MTFIGWLEINNDLMYQVCTDKESIHVQKYMNGKRVVDASKSFTPSEFKSFVNALPIEKEKLSTKVTQLF